MPLSSRAVKTATGIRVPDEIVTALGSSKRPPVRVAINGHTYCGTVASMRGAFILSVSADIHSITGVAGGDEVDVDVELDTEPCEVVVPPDFATALDHDKTAKRVFDGLSYRKKQRFVLSIEQAKTDATRN